MDHPDAEFDRIVRRANLARLAIDQNLAAIGRVESVGDAHRRRLAGAVFTDDGVNRGRLDFDADRIIGQNRAKAFGDVAQLDHWFILSITVICFAMIFFFASSAARMASGETRFWLLLSIT